MRNLDLHLLEHSFRRQILNDFDSCLVQVSGLLPGFM